MGKTGKKEKTPKTKVYSADEEREFIGFLSEGRWATAYPQEGGEMKGRITRLDKEKLEVKFRTPNSVVHTFKPSQVDIGD